MASVESIGACSLDFELSASESFLAKDLTASECTLQSVNLTPSMKESVRKREGIEVVRNGGFSADEQRPLSLNADNVRQDSNREFSVAEIKLPSYVGISCAINGYPNYSRFCRSRDNSPARSSFRKSSLEPRMLDDMYSQELHSLPFDDIRSTRRCARSYSDTNGTMRSVYTESKNVTISKQLQIPLKATKKYMTEVTIANGQHSQSEATASAALTNGHASEKNTLAKEVGIVGAKSLVQQRIESLYGKFDDVKVSCVKSSRNQIHYVNGDSKTASSNITVIKNHIGEKSPPVFRHLTKDFRKQLEGDSGGEMKFHFGNEMSSAKVVKKPQKSSIDILSKTADKNDIASHANGVSFDECDKIATEYLPVIQDISPEQEEPSLKCAIGTVTREAGYKFLTKVDVERQKIQVQIDHWDHELSRTLDIPEEASGKIRAACGKANLLLNQKFQQFQDLCKKNIEEDPSIPFYTTESDLAGFWDMVMLQVDDINLTFKDIKAMKENNWKEVVSEKPVVSQNKTRRAFPGAISKSNPCTPKHSAKSAESARAREEARKQLLAAKKKGRQQHSNTNDSHVAIFTPASSN